MAEEYRKQALVWRQLNSACQHRDRNRLVLAATRHVDIGRPALLFEAVSCLAEILATEVKRIALDYC